MHCEAKPTFCDCHQRHGYMLVTKLNSGALNWGNHHAAQNLVGFSEKPKGFLTSKTLPIGAWLPPRPIRDQVGVNRDYSSAFSGRLRRRLNPLFSWHLARRCSQRFPFGKIILGSQFLRLSSSSSANSLSFCAFEALSGESSSISTISALGPVACSAEMLSGISSNLSSLGSG